jgi:CRP-like cAMP-binding protein
MFGHLSLLQKRPRKATVRAISYTTLVTVSEAEFRELMQQAPQLAAAVKASAEKRGVSVDGKASGSETAAPAPPWVTRLKAGLRFRS